MTEAALADAFDQVREPAMSARARTLAGQIGRDGAGIGAKRLAADYG